MAVLEWDKAGEHRFDAGIRKGVLYLPDGTGLPWNGLTSVEAADAAEIEPMIFDGVHYDDVITINDFTGTLKAFTYPDEFLYFEGVPQDQVGFFVTAQKPHRFGLSYQTTYGDDAHGSQSGYKIHILYNVTAIPTSRNYVTIADTVEPLEFEWNLTAIPQEISGYRPTAHIIFDSGVMDPYLLSDIEDIIYGSEDNDPHLPSLSALAGFVRSWDRLIIVDNGDGTWTATSPIPDVIQMLDDTTFQITSETAHFLDADTYTISSSDKNEGDIWLPPL